MAQNHPLHVILGTAGHIDHGKSTLVKALTGTDPDRLKEEKERGITIDLGFAHLVYPDGFTVGIVDVPGHERLIKNMLAGAGGIDMVLFVVDAEEGIMPQTREHLAICQLLGLDKGIFAMTKADLVEEEWLLMVTEELRAFLQSTPFQSAPIIPVSAVTGYNVETLKETIRQTAFTVTPKPVNSLFRLPVDRVFTLRGYGTVVTGTALSGRISLNETIEILPSGIKSKIRGLHVNGMEVETALAGQRVAVNVAGVEKEAVQRGDVLTLPGFLSPSRLLDCAIVFLDNGPTLKSGSLVHFHTGTQELTGRMVLYDHKDIKPGQKSYCQFRFSSTAKVAAMAGDRFIIRRFSPLQTIGGGVILDSMPSRVRKQEKLADLSALETGTLEEKLAVKIQRSGIEGINRQTLRGWLRTDFSKLDSALSRLINKNAVIVQDDRLLHQSQLNGLSDKIHSILKSYHEGNPLHHGMPKEALKAEFRRRIEPKWFSLLLGRISNIIVEGNFVRLTSFQAALIGQANDLNAKFIDLLQTNPFQPPMKDELAQLLGIDKKQVTDRLNYLASEHTL
ncbi:MAG TPA: selenocysteine-specific translation elongation factor, partial [Thermodesulfovibrionia bacterium]|nr:selenocysteine-specific translation elongation factor [Thermodesulfovibrionia bacterium]